MDHYDLIILGTGSGNAIITPDFDDARIAIIEKGVFGGTCLNRGCIPSKMFVYAADLVEMARSSSKLGVDLSIDGVRWGDIVDRVFGRIDPISAGGEDYRDGLDHVDLYHGHGRFTGPRTLAVTMPNGSVTEMSGTNVVIATGATPVIPGINGIDHAGYETSDTIMRIRELPARLTILGGGYIATELAHVFDAMGVEVTLVVRGPRLLRWEDEDVSRRFTEIFSKRCNVQLGASIDSVHRNGDGELVFEVSRSGEQHDMVSDMLLVATGREPTTEALDLHLAGVACHNGYVITDPQMRTNVDGVWALGDVTNPDQLKHTANAEAKIVAHNIAHPNQLRSVNLSPTPHAVFSHPQVASVGRTEQELRGDDVPYLVGLREHGSTAYGWAMEDTTGFAKVLAHAETREILGAHIIGPQAATLIHQFIQAMVFGQNVDELATGMLYIHPAMSELVENALLAI